jgi:hypothetical protein
MMTMKSIARKEFTATNGNTVRLDLSPEGNVKLSILKGKHFQGVGELTAGEFPPELALLIMGS